MADKYISVETAKTVAAVRHSDPIIRSAINGVLDATPGVEIPTNATGFPERRHCPSCGGEALSEFYDLRENLFESDAFLYRISCLCGRQTSWCDTLADADNAWNTCVTNADRLRAMDDAQLADFLHESILAADTPWNYAFSKVFCDACEPESCNTDQECPHGRPVDWWLRQEVSDGE